MHSRAQVVGSRPAAVAGLFYPRDAQALRSSVLECLGQAAVEPELEHIEGQVLARGESQPKALIAPHAGYLYSGAIAGSAYGSLKSCAHEIERVVLIGPSHFVPFSGLAVPRVEAFETPLGNVPIDDVARREVLRVPQVISADGPHAREHSIEVQLPFLQVLLGNFRLLPIAAGDATAKEVAAALECLWGDDHTLIVVSSDLSHYLDYDAAREIDQATAASVLNYSTEVSAEQACGCVGINGLTQTACRRKLQVRLLDLRNSGDTAADRSSVVGYGAFAFYPTRTN